MNLIFQRSVELTALTVDQLREFLITLLHAPKSSLENRSWARKSGARLFIAISYGELDQHEGRWVQDRNTGDKGFLNEHETSSGSTTRTNAIRFDSPSKAGSFLPEERRQGHRKGQERKVQRWERMSSATSLDPLEKLRQMATSMPDGLWSQTIDTVTADR